MALGLSTAPVLYGIADEPDLRELVERKFSKKGDVPAAYKLVMKSNGLQKTKELATFHAQAAVDACCAAGEWRAGLSIWQRASRTQQLRPDTKMYRLLARACRAAGADDELADLLASAEREGVPMMALQEADDDGVGPADTSSDDDDDEVAEELATTALGWENM